MVSKYYEIYKKSKSKKEFIEICLKTFNIGYHTARRRWYDGTKWEKEEEKSNLKKQQVIKEKVEKKKRIIEVKEKYNTLPKNIVEIMPQKNDELYIPPMNANVKPDQLKLLTYTDMLSKGFTPSDDFLRKYGFSSSEINWLKKNRGIEK